ncbi:formylglycine-generating enzyme family protein [Clostridium bowmanii]|uniref:formylglycine-generating enzyme family protein n=1 Tax=Clostridium bowmanii TaxID=132925 RepID=UPI001C0B7E9C|nr:formylglycine-generating enzyme family protein [Clostridium bowmanii]MBU3188287.1 formylglycine-generating enzyme family protein [Clostridium bowmanii]MCA1072675.1 formylglycine-generating enzyme family protein [Clostridium bowmanii]
MGVKSIDSNTNNYLNKQMMRIPGGVEYLRDYRDEHKWHSSDSKMSISGQKGNLTEIKRKLEIKPFLLAKYPVTKNLYEVILHKAQDNVEVNYTPIVNVSWYDAILFCNLLSKECGLNECYTFELNGSNVFCDWNADGYRLPTDAEWQYACKSTSTGYRYGGIEDIAWYCENSEGRLHEVGKKNPNDWELYDMLGNTWEWCWDLYDEKTYDQYRIFRGGSWAEQARGCGATCRRRGHPSFGIDDLGFRLAKSF